MVKILEEDDGSGWVKVADEAGGKGLVPASYIEVLDAVSSTSDTPPPYSANEREVHGEYGMRSGYFYERSG